VITRHDFAVMVAPALLVLFVQTQGRARWAVLAAGAGPLLLWSIFSLIYYGSLWPNSAYAKLNNGLSLAESFAASQLYFRDLIKYDGVTALVIVVAALRGLLQGKWQMRALALGLLLYLLYLGTAGGDYMGGRLFSAPFVLAVAMLALNVRLRWWWTAALWFALTIGLGLHKGWLVRDVHPHAEERKMSQHAWMYPFTGWQSAQRVADFHNMPWGEQGLKARDEKHAVVAKCAVGLYGFNAGPAVYIVDPLAIADGFLARLPSKKPAYPGHYERAFPEGYVETITSGKNQLRDPSLKTLYDQTQLLSRASLFDGARLRAIWELNTGGDRRLVSLAAYDPNATFAPGLAKTSGEPLSCMGQLDPLLTVRLR
jgi:arabinofuranosyltransferase